MNDHTTVPKIKIMISSTTKDLYKYRKNALEIINKLADENRERLQLLGIGMETESQTGERETAIEISKNWVEESDWIVLILGWWYGTITTNENENLERLSPTHWEYKHAMKLKEKNPERKVFVFVTGEKDTPDRYQETNVDYGDLKDDKGAGTPEQNDKIQKFRMEVSDAHISYFKNLVDFTTKLEKTLRSTITDLEDRRPVERPGKGLASLILEFKIPIKTCIRKVRLLADYKELHDKLHEIRQKAIRPWREQVLVQWNTNPPLNETMQKVLTTAGNKSLIYLELIKTILANDPSVDDERLLKLLSKVIEMAFDEEKDSASTIECFSDKVDRFSSHVQAAFTRANKVMIAQSDSLNDLHVKLADSLSLARKDHALTSKDDDLFDKWIGEILETRKNLKIVLETHDNWQSLHDQLERIDDARMSKESFQDQLEDFCDSNLGLFNDLISGWTAQLSSINNTTSESKVVSLKSTFAALLAALLKDSASNTYDAILSTYDEMKHDFDDVFYDVDRFTLVQVKKSKVKVDGFDQLLDELGQRPV